MAAKDGGLSLHIPAPKARPGETPDFSHIVIPPAGETPRPAIDTAPAEMRDLAYGLIRVLDDEGTAVGPWALKLEPDVLRRALRAMMLTRVFDNRMFAAHRQGKVTFFIKSTGEEAIGVAQSMVLRKGDMNFPSYRTTSFLMEREYPLLDMFNQNLATADDPLQGRQLPILYSAKAYGFYTLSGNVGSRFHHAVGWAMASAYRGDTKIALACIGDGTTAENEFHTALTFATVYRAPVILTVTNNQWAISSFQGIAGGESTTFAARGVGYGLPALRVDGNDFLAVYAATQWAAERARANLGATVIEMVSYRAEGHSTSDDPTRYRPIDEATHWPLGDPIERLKGHLTKLGEWSDERHEQLYAELTDTITEVYRQADAVGALGVSKPPVGEMFENLFATPDWRLLEQRKELGV